MIIESSAEEERHVEKEAVAGASDGTVAFDIASLLICSRPELFWTVDVSLDVT